MTDLIRLDLAVSFNLECAHRDEITGNLHGHSYVVTVWFQPVDPRSNVVAHAEAIKQIGGMLDHTDLNKSCIGPRMEDIAHWLAHRIELLAAIKLARINVSRPTLGYQCELRA